MARTARLLVVVSITAAMLAEAGATALIPVTRDGAGIKPSTLRLDGRSYEVWQSDDANRTLTFGTGAPMPEGGELFVKIDYLDRGYGRIDVRLAGNGGDTLGPDRHLGLTLADTGKPASARMRFTAGASRLPEELSIQVQLHGSTDRSLAITEVSAHDTPFDHPEFRYVISDPWKVPYDGPSRPVDNSTLKGRVMTGYQGWFRTPNDPYGGGWHHWGDIPSGTFSVDMWPDISSYPAHTLQKACDVKLKSGKQAYLFSSAWPAVTDIHFGWMREHDIDGAFLQRFVNDGFHSISGGPEWILANVRASAHREGRLWAIEYDVSGYPDRKLLETLKTDWKWFVDEFGIRGDSHYAHEDGKPVVFIWGLPFPDRNISPATADAVVDFFKNDPVYGGNFVIGGIPGNWRDMDAAWQNHIANYNCVLAWMSRSYARDIADLRSLGLPYYAHAMPGFSWANLKHLPAGDTLAYTPRNGGEHYWSQLKDAAAAGADRLFIGMFDEYDEATAIMPMSDDTPEPPSRPGVAATFYNGDRAREHGRLVHRTDLEINFDGNPPAQHIDAENFYVRMGGRIRYPGPGPFTFSIEGAPGDDAELTLNGERILDVKGLNGIVSSNVPVPAEPGDHGSFRLEYRHRAANGRLRLYWESPGMARQAVPADVLEDAWGRFITNDGRPADWWMKLTAKGKRLMNDARADRSPGP